jgi:hypothetical protein
MGEKSPTSFSWLSSKRVEVQIQAAQSPEAAASPCAKPSFFYSLSMGMLSPKKSIFGLL